MSDSADDNARRLIELRKLADSDQPGAIEFALMLDRAIGAFSNDPEMLRSAVYELARTKLRDQLGHPDSRQTREAFASLEMAIGKVEAFSQSQPALLLKPTDLAGSAVSISTPGASHAQQTIARSRSRARSWTGYVLALLIAAGTLMAILASRGFFGSSVFTTFSQSLFATKDTKPAEVPSAPSAPPPKKRPMPPAYGAFAVVGEDFVELQPIGIRPPDIRVAVSSQVKLPERAILSTNMPTFMVYERFPPAVARAEARVMARISRVRGDSDSSNPASTWVVRNITTPFRVLMDSERPDILMVSPNADVELKPGRYALVVGNNAFDFTIAGKTDEAVHCLEQVIGMNGTFYSPCK
jgi:hypothetical protein